MRSGIVPEVTRRLDATAGLQRIAPRDGWEMWRVSPPAGEQALVAPPRLRLETPAGTVLVTTTGQQAGTDTTVDVPPDSTLVVAEPPGWAAHAVVAVDGITLEPVAETATPTYVLPAGTAHLTVTVVDSSRWWHVAQVLAVLALVVPRDPVRPARVTGGPAMSGVTYRSSRLPVAARVVVPGIRPSSRRAGR